MRHIVDIRGNEAICACGRRAVRASQQEAINWASQHGHEAAATELSTPDSPPRDARCPECGERGVAHATDDQLRAALQERGYVTAKTNENNDWRGAFEVQRDHNFELARERDEWRLRAESAIDPEALRKWGLNPDAVREYESHADAMRAMGFERDVGMWRARAEAAEAHLHDPRRCIRIETGDEPVELGSVHDCGRIELVVTRVDNERLPGRDFLVEQVMRESGPGIAAVKPDNSVAFLDEDLLCEDA